MAHPPADTGLDNQRPVTDPLMPDENTLLDYINSCPAPPSLRKIAKVFNIGKERHASLRRLLRDMATRKLLVVNRRAFAAPNTPSDVTVLELFDFDDNGDGRLVKDEFKWLLKGLFAGLGKPYNSEVLDLYYKDMQVEFLRQIMF